MEIRKTSRITDRLCLLSNIDKVLTKVLTERPEKTLDENQPRDQAGFRSGYSTTDHIHVVNPLKEKCRGYNISLCIAFVDIAFGTLRILHISRMRRNVNRNVYNAGKM